jgi:hypothetical protein
MLHKRPGFPLPGIFSALALCLFFAPLVYLSFFSHPTGDDYLGAYVSNQYGFIDYINYLRHSWGSRYLSYTFTKAFALGYYSFRHYEVPALVLFAANALSCCIVLLTIRRYLLPGNSKGRMLYLALAYMALQVTCLPEIWSAYYWISGAYNHQPGVIFMHLEIACLVACFNTTRRVIRWLCIGLLILLIVLINGINETQILCNGIFLFLVLALYGKRKDVAWISIAALAYLATLYFVVSAPGNNIRTENIPRAGVAKAAAIAVGRTAVCFWSVFSNPLFWLSVVFVVVHAPAVAFNPQRMNGHALLVRYKRVLWVLPFAVLLAVLVPVMYVSNGSMPERTNNLLVQFALICLLTTAFLLARLFAFRLPETGKAFSIAAQFLFLLLLFCNPNFGEWIKSSIAAQLYRDVMQQRTLTLQKAAADGQKTVQLLDYPSAADSLMATRYAQEKRMIQLIMLRRPAAITPPDDDLATAETRGNLQLFYHIDSIAVTHRQFTNW